MYNKEEEITVSKFCTIEGHEIVRDGEYETRSGKKAIIVGFRDGAAFPIIGYFEKSGISTWTSEGALGHLGELPSDLMRPWRNQQSEGIAEGLVAAMMDGWIKWEGGSCPVDDGLSSVEVKFRDGTSDTSLPDLFHGWCHDNDFENGDYDIVAYRIVKEPSPEVKVYKLSEMWKVWCEVNPYYQGIAVDASLYESKEKALAYTNYITTTTTGKVLAITPADATEFYEGQGLDSEARVG